MKEIEIFIVSDVYLDGGSRDKIVTNVGIFSLRQKLGNIENKNGFYVDGTHVGRELNEALKKALDKYLKNKNNDYVLKQVASLAEMKEIRDFNIKMNKEFPWWSV